MNSNTFGKVVCKFLFLVQSFKNLLDVLSQPGILLTLDLRILSLISSGVVCSVPGIFSSLRILLHCITKKFSCAIIVKVYVQSALLLLGVCKHFTSLLVGIRAVEEWTANFSLGFIKVSRKQTTEDLVARSVLPISLQYLLNISLTF